MLSIMAGFLVGMGGMIYLTLGGVVGAIFFSLGLTTIVIFKFNLFTGKAGLYADGKISFTELAGIWFGNYVGAIFAAVGSSMLPQAEKIRASAQAIMELRNGNPPLVNFALGAMCGLLMYVAVQGFAKTGSYIFLIAPVAFFILCGYNHCVADMFYATLGTTYIRELEPLIYTTFGNLLGANVIPLINQAYGREG